MRCSDISIVLPNSISPRKAVEYHGLFFLVGCKYTSKLSMRRIWSMPNRDICRALLPLLLRGHGAGGGGGREVGVSITLAFGSSTMGTSPASCSWIDPVGSASSPISSCSTVASSTWVITCQDIKE